MKTLDWNSVLLEVILTVLLTTIVSVSPWYRVPSGQAGFYALLALFGLSVMVVVVVHWCSVKPRNQETALC